MFLRMKMFHIVLQMKMCGTKVLLLRQLHLALWGTLFVMFTALVIVQPMCFSSRMTSACPHLMMNWGQFSLNPPPPPPAPQPHYHFVLRYDIIATMATWGQPGPTTYLTVLYVLFVMYWSTLVVQRAHI